jgi:hypothetical protein
LDYDVPAISLPSGGTVARAKRTNRAEARRRYRATLIDDPESMEEDLDADSDAAEDRPAPAARRDRASASSSTVPARRPSVVGALREAFRPTDLRGDLAVLPQLLRHRSFLIPLATIVVAAVAVTVSGGTDALSRILAPYFLVAPPVAPVFIAGFMAPRASYLLGGLLGFISQIAYIGVLSSPAVQQAATGTTAAPDVSFGALGGAFVVAVSFGAFYAAAAAWYKRFLALASPSRAARARATGRPNDRPRKRDSNDRPMLARRR